MVHGCVQCGPKGSLFMDSYKVEGKYYVELYCMACMHIWTKETVALQWGADPLSARALAIKEMFRRELRRVPKHLTAG